jgi:tryptophan 2,3-dioxygenase
MLAHPNETTLYKEGTFLPEPHIADFEILMRRPELFAVAGSQIAGARALVIERLAKGLKVDPATVPVVRALYRMVKGLPEYAWNTRKLPERSIAFRDTFLKAKSPEQFVFVLLPEALGLPPISASKSGRENAEQFFAALNQSLQHLARATPEMLNRCRDVLLQACGLQRGEANWSKLRSMAVAMEPAITEPQLLGFVRRVVQSGTGPTGVESVLALIANRPPINWTDTDVERFPDAAAAVGRAFSEAANSKQYVRSTELELMALSSKERHQLQRLEAGIRAYISNTAKHVPTVTQRAPTFWVSGPPPPAMLPVSRLPSF